MKVNIGISEANRTKLAELLGPLLADEFVLYTLTRNAHWNVQGPDFHALHKFFEAQYEQLEDFIDETAERIRTLGHPTPATLADFVNLSRIEEQVGTVHHAGIVFIEMLLAGHEQLIRQLRTDVKHAGELGDDGTADYLTGLMENHEKMAWMLRAHLLE